MKKIVGLRLVLVCGLMLVGCGSNNTKKETNSISGNSSISEPTSLENNSSIGSSTSSIKDDSFVSSGPLTKVGQWTTNEGAKVTLQKIYTNNNKIELMPNFNISIDEVKLLKHENVSASDYDIEEKYVLNNVAFSLQVSYTITNETENAYDFNGIEYVVTDQKQQIDVSANDKAISREVHFQPSTVVPDNAFIIYLNPDTAETVQSISFKTWPIFSDGKLADEKTIDITFE